MNNYKKEEDDSFYEKLAFNLYSCVGSYDKKVEQSDKHLENENRELKKFMNDILETEIRFYLVKHIEIYTLEKSEPDENYDPEYDGWRDPYKKNIVYYDATARRFFPKNINDIISIKNPYEDTDHYCKIECYYEILIATKLKDQETYPENLIKINEETKKQLAERFNEFFIPSEKQLQTWDHFIYPPNQLSSSLKRSMLQTKDMFAFKYLLIKKADDWHEKEGGNEE